MKFSTDEFYKHLKEEATNPNGDGSIFTELYDTMKADIMGIIKMNLKGDLSFEAEDVFHQVYFSVWRALPQFLKDSEHMHENQRAAWLITIMNRRIADCLRKYYRKREREQPIEPIIEPIDDGKNQPEMLFFSTIEENGIEKSLRELFSIRTSPEKIFGFVYAKVIIPIEAGRACNGKPAEAQNCLNGMKLYAIRRQMKRDLEGIIQRNISEDSFAGLDESLDCLDEHGIAIGEQLFSLDVKKITDGTNRIQTKLQAKDMKGEQKNDSRKSFGF